jgi:hypothetical protein
MTSTDENAGRKVPGLLEVLALVPDPRKRRGANYRPFCAAQRWAMIIALSRFGTFSGLTASHSSTSDVYPDTATFTFYGSSYASKYISFEAVEETENFRQGNSSSQSVPYVTLQTPTAAEQALIA